MSSSTVEPPFRPREKLIEKQKYFQSIHKPTYLKGPFDKLTSVAIPLALATTSLYLIVTPLLSLSLSTFLFLIVALILSFSLFLFFRVEGSTTCLMG